MKVKFNSKMESFSNIPLTASDATIEDEPMIYGGSWQWTKENGGPLTQSVMSIIENDLGNEILEHSLKGYHPVIDTKSVMLMPEWYPCIPGWHCDGVIRKDRQSQPCMDTLNENVKHYICSVSSDPGACNTGYLNESVTVEVDPDSVWTSVDNALKDRKALETDSGVVYKFTRPTLHKGMKATRRCWRYFFRLSFYHMPAANRLRNQVQVYTNNVGW